jgi:hypothetical protein
LHPYGRALCDKHYKQLMEMRERQRERKKRGAAQPKLSLEES